MSSSNPYMTLHRRLRGVGGLISYSEILLFAEAMHGTAMTPHHSAAVERLLHYPAVCEMIRDTYREERARRRAHGEGV